ncbi:hypothetical protein Taro_056676 [Colocasia esculenta]|uniref:Uncharacterized protein n=1 Tax=Colocasia esculenta TaxID=4460 RepID=A0A843XUM1_COLES|nr:hypothetical protein [Colocasia esculenta]
MFYECAASLQGSCACHRLQLSMSRMRGECGRSACSCLGGASGALVVLMEVLPGPACVASAALLAAVFSLMECYVFVSGHRCVALWFEVCCLVGLRSGEVLPGRLLALLVEVLLKAASCCFRCCCSLSLCKDELSLLLVGLSMLQSAQALSVEVLCPWLII